MPGYRDSETALTSVGRCRIEVENAKLAELAVNKLKKLVSLASESNIGNVVVIYENGDIQLQLFLSRLFMSRRKYYACGVGTYFEHIGEEMRVKDYFTIILENKIHPDVFSRYINCIEAEIEKG